MLSVSGNLKEKRCDESADDSLTEDVFGDVNYMRQSASLINNCLHKGSYVVQMPDGDILVTETKTVTFQYTWDEDKGKLVRITNSVRNKKKDKKS